MKKTNKLSLFYRTLDTWLQANYPLLRAKNRCGCFRKHPISYERAKYLAERSYL